MKRFFTFLKTELKLSVWDMNMPIFAILMPLVIFIILGIIYGTKPAYDGASYTFMEQSFGAVSAVAICASGLMGLPQAISGLRELKILKRFCVTPVSPVFVLGVELAMYVVYCLVSLATLAAAAWRRIPDRPASSPPSSISPCSSFPARPSPSRSCRRLCRRSSVSSR